MDDKVYQPAPHVLDRLKQVDFIAAVGPSAAGKTTVMNTAVELYPQLRLVLNHTSRAPRPGEQQRKNYSFKTRAEMEARIATGGYVQVAPSLFGDFYATPPESYAVDGVSVLEVLAVAVPTFRALPFRSCRTVFVVPPSWEVWQNRLKDHSLTPEKLKGRLAEAKESFKFALRDDQTQFVISKDLAQAGEDFAVLALGRPLPKRLQADQSRARVIVRDLLDRLEAL